MTGVKVTIIKKIDVNHYQCKIDKGDYEYEEEMEFNEYAAPSTPLKKGEVIKANYYFKNNGVPRITYWVKES